MNGLSNIGVALRNEVTRIFTLAQSHLLDVAAFAAVIVEFIFCERLSALGENRLVVDAAPLRVLTDTHTVKVRIPVVTHQTYERLFGFLKKKT